MNAPLPSSHFCDNNAQGPRFREAGELVLDHVHRDGRVDDLWLGLAPREFALLWRLAATPGDRLNGAQLREQAWHIAFDPEDDGVTADIERVRAKLAAAGAGHLICTDGDGCHFLDIRPPAAWA
ncbi:MAG: response regulator transcription factor [Porphyrobacter sp.]|nr:response regulator transcription factor [Porphyrobacter sp.]